MREAEGDFITVVNVKTEEAPQSALKMEEDTVNQGTQAASKNGKGKKTDSPRRALAGISSVNILILAQRKDFGHPNRRTVKGNKFVPFKPLNGNML